MHLTRTERARIVRSEAYFHYLRTNGITEGIDLLALAATRRRQRLEPFLGAIEDATSRRDSGEQLSALINTLDVPAARRLAILLADQGREGEALLILDALARVLGPQSLLKEGRFVLAELMVEAGHSAQLEEMFARLHIRRDDPAQAWLLAANACNPFSVGSPETRAIDAWCGTVNEMFAADRLEPIRIAPGDEAPFDRIMSGSARIVDDGPLVTVVIPTYAPGRRIATAIESLLGQSHRSLQIIIADDASPADAAADLDRWTERDSRIEVLHLPENGGPYLARNTAVSERARGIYVTVHDDDDWSHPRKIESQVAHLEASRKAVANMVNGVRASDQLSFGRVNGNPVWAQQALSSLMVRREVFDQIGYWDLVNRAADAEFNDRIRSWTRERIPVVGRVPLMFYRTRWGSLSDGEFRRGYMDPRRRWYFQSYRAWHEACRADGIRPFVPVDNRGMRAFSAPADFLGSRAKKESRTIDADLVVVNDFRDRGGGVDRICSEIESTLAAGSQVAVVQVDSPDVPATGRIHPRVLRAALHDGAHVASLEDHVVESRAIGGGASLVE